MESLPNNLALINRQTVKTGFRIWQQKLQDYLSYRFKRFHPKRQRTGRK